VHSIDKTLVSEGAPASGEAIPEEITLSSVRWSTVHDSFSFRGSLVPIFAILSGSAALRPPRGVLVFAHNPLAAATHSRDGTSSTYASGTR
jgi:hypothetical protein